LQRASLRSRVFAVVALSAVPALVGSVVGIAALSDVNHGVVEINQRSVRTLAALGDLRDMEGDMRGGVRGYVDAAPADRPALKQDIGTTDNQVTPTSLRTWPRTPAGPTGSAP